MLLANTINSFSKIIWDSSRGSIFCNLLNLPTTPSVSNWTLVGNGYFAVQVFAVPASTGATQSIDLSSLGIVSNTVKLTYGAGSTVPAGDPFSAVSITLEYSDLTTLVLVTKSVNTDLTSTDIAIDDTKTVKSITVDRKRFGAEEDYSWIYISKLEFV